MTLRRQRKARSGPAADASTAGLRILVVEDEFLLACSLEEDLRLFGCAVIGPFGDLAAATEAARRESFDLAILDINLNGRMVYPLADELLARGVAVMFLSGYAVTDLPERFRSTPQLAKPYHPTGLYRAIHRSLRKMR
jgi:DNA-binding response OmpR family regulator